MAAFKTVFTNHSEEIKNRVKDLFEGEIVVSQEFDQELQNSYYVIIPKKHQFNEE